MNFGHEQEAPASRDIGKTAVFLASDDSSFMLGSELLVDGGSTYVAK